MRTFSVSVAAPPRGEAGVYRLGTRVRNSDGRGSIVPTFSLPVYAEGA